MTSTGPARPAAVAGGRVGAAAAGVAADATGVAAAAGAGRACGYACANAAPRRSIAATQRARGALRLGRLGQRPDHRDPLGPGRAHRGDVGRRRCPPIAKNGTRGVRGRVADELEPDRRPPRLGRRRVHRPDADVVDASAGGGVDLRGRVGREPDQPVRRRRPRGPRRPRASSWPTCTPSAPAAATRSGRSLRMNSAPCSDATAREPPPRGDDLARRRRPSSAAGRCPRRRAGRRQERVGLRVADEVEAGGGQALRGDRSRRQVWQESTALGLPQREPYHWAERADRSPPTV